MTSDPEAELHVEVLIRLAEQSLTYALHIETQRSTMTNFLVTIAAAATAFVTQAKFGIETLPVSVLICALGVYGTISSLKFSQAFHLHYARARRYQSELDILFPRFRLRSLRHAANCEHAHKFEHLGGAFRRFEFYYVWALLHCLIAVTGVVLVLITMSTFSQQLPT